MEGPVVLLVEKLCSALDTDFGIGEANICFL
jgi:hypothetical protein